MDLALTVLGLLLLCRVAYVHLKQRHALRTARGETAATLARYPSVTVIRPIKGLDPDLELNLAHAFEDHYPGAVEILFVLDDLTEPALPAVEQAVRSHREQGQARPARVLFCGPPPAGLTGKMNAMIVGLREARGELVAFADSDIRPRSTTLRALVETLLSSAQAGSAFAPVAMQPKPERAGDVGYALLLNGLYAPTFALAAHRSGGRLPFIMGQFMVLRREAIHAIGGLESAAGQLVDDMFLGARIAAAGYENRVIAEPIDVIAGGLSLRDFARIYARWIAFSRTGLPGLSFKLVPWLTGLTFWAGLLLFAGAASTALWFPATLGALTTAAVSASISGLHRAGGGRPLGAWGVALAFLLLLTGPLVYASILLRPTIVWRGREYRLDLHARLATDPVPSGQ